MISVPVQLKLGRTQLGRTQPPELWAWSCSGVDVGGFECNHAIPVQSKLGHRPQNCGLGPVPGMDVGGFEHGHSISVQSKLRRGPQNCGLGHVLGVVLNMIV